jgi:hypothetical protein
MPASAFRIRLGAGALAVAGVLFLLYPALRPWGDKSLSDSAAVTAAFASGSWVASHLFAMIGFILTSLGLLAVWKVVSHSNGERAAFAAVVFTWIGAGLTLPYYGAEDFALHTVAAEAVRGRSLDVVALAEAIRYQPVAMTTFGLGLIGLGAGAVLAAIAVWRSGVLPRFSGVLFALGLALFLPQFFTPPAARVAHGVLLCAGLIWLAVALWNSSRRSSGV